MPAKFLHKRFDVEIAREVSRKKLWWPPPEDLLSGSFGGNQSYCDFRWRTWAEARACLDLEREYIQRIETAIDPYEEAEAIAEERYEEPDEALWALDIGVASTVISLSAAKCIPFSSCNGGAFGRGHREDHPLVVFHARPQSVDLLLECAERADVGLDELDGAVLAYSDRIINMMAFAGAIIGNSVEFGVKT